MVTNNPNSVDLSYKTIFYIFGIIFYLYFFEDGEEIEFKYTELPFTGQRKDMVIKVDKKIIKIIEFMSNAIYDKKMLSLYDYYKSEDRNPDNHGLPVVVEVISIAKQTRGITKIKINKNIDFNIDPIFLKDKDGQKVLSNLITKTITQEKLSNNECLDLLLLPDMDIEMPIDALMNMICYILINANVSKKMQTKLILGENTVLARFYNENEIKEKVDMLIEKTKNTEAQSTIEKFGYGFYQYNDGFFDGFQNGKTKGKNEGIDEGKIEIIISLIEKGYDLESICNDTDLSEETIEKLKRKLNAF